jgi:hypothetical protein
MRMSKKYRSSRYFLLIFINLKEKNAYVKTENFRVIFSTSLADAKNKVGPPADSWLNQLVGLVCMPLKIAILVAYM